MAKAPAAILAVARSESAPPREQSKPVINETASLDETAVPYKREELFVTEVGVDYGELIESLRKKSDLNQVSRCDATVVFSNADGDLKVWQLAPLARVLLCLCDGQRTVAEITQEFSLVEIDLGEIPVEKAVLFGLVQLYEDGFIGLSSSPLTWVDDEADIGPSAFSLPPKSSNTQQPWPAVSAEKSADQ